MRTPGRVRVYAAAAFLGIGFLLFYLIALRLLPVSYLDEALWTGKSYFFDLVLRGKFAHPLWESPQSYDEPKLVEYVNGAILYPRYMTETGGNRSYIGFLSDHNLLCGECIIQYFVREKVRMTTYPQFYAVLNSPEADRITALIYPIRTVNAVLTAFSVSVAFLLAVPMLGVGPALLFGILYGTNGVLMETGLRAHGDAVFFLLLLSSLLSLRQLLTRNRWQDAVTFGLLSGLTASAKMVGFVLPVLYAAFLPALVWQKITRTGDVLKYSALPVIAAVLTVGVFFLVNPYLYTRPVANLRTMIRFRYDQSALGAKEDPANALPTPSIRLRSVGQRFFGTGPDNYSAPFFLRPYAGPLNVLYGIFFILGCIRLIRRATARKIRFAEAYLPLTGLLLLGSMLQWLLVGWERYYLFVTIPVLAIETAGATSLLGAWSAFATRRAIPSLRKL